MWAARWVRAAATASAFFERAPSRAARAAREASAPEAAIRSITASAWVRSIRPFRNARRVNSPGRACRNPAANSASSPAASAAGEPWHWISAVSSPV